MKNVVLGLIEGGMILYMLLLLISIYSIATRKNELTNALSQMVEDTLLNYYGKESVTETEVLEHLTNLAAERIQSASSWSVSVTVMDMEKGLLGVCIHETFRLPNGFRKELEVYKTAIVEQLDSEPVIWRVEP